MSETRAIRDAILQAQLETSNHGETPHPAHLYIPPAHIKSLNLDSTLVVGGRGVGKSFWTAALADAGLRQLLIGSVRQMEQLEVCIGFKVDEDIDQRPNSDSFTQCLQAGCTPYDLWRCVILHWLANQLQCPLPASNWLQRLRWLQEQPEEASRLMSQANRHFQEQSRHALFVFDALDRTSNDWRIMDEIVRGLLQATLWLKPFSNLHAKVFLRDDQMERTVTNFADASKLLASRTTLSWERHDLHGLLWQRLLNAPGNAGEQLRAAFKSITGSLPPLRDDIWQLPDEARRDTPLQRALFERLAGPWMGRDARRGVPYVWAVNHLADGRGQTSPRSFLAAIAEATADSLARYPEHEHPLHYESIKRGIQQASQIRVSEMAEDYPWVPSLLECLSGMRVPCDYEQILARWQQEFPAGPSSVGDGSNGLPPQHAARGWDGVRADLERIGLLEQRRDGRIDMPDLYRVGFNLGRHGGVKPRSK